MQEQQQTSARVADATPSQPSDDDTAPPRLGERAEVRAQFETFLTRAHRAFAAAARISDRAAALHAEAQQANASGKAWQDAARVIAREAAHSFGEEEAALLLWDLVARKLETPPHAPAN